MLFRDVRLIGKKTGKIAMGKQTVAKKTEPRKEKCKQNNPPFLMPRIRYMKRENIHPRLEYALRIFHVSG